MAHAQHAEDGDPSVWERWLPASGIVAMILLIGTIVVLPAAPDFPNAQLASWYAHHATPKLWQSYLSGVALILFLLFVAGVAGVIRRAEPDLGALFLLALAGGAGFVIVELGAGIADAVGALVAEQGGNVGVVDALAALAQTAVRTSYFLEAVLLGAASTALLQSRSAPRWVCWLGMAGVPACLLGAGYYRNGGPIGLFSFLSFVILVVWTIALSVALLLRARRRVTQPRPVPA